MPRITGVDLPKEKRIDIALTYIRGVGRKNVVSILKAVNMAADRRVHTLTDEEVNKITAYIEKNYVVEGELRQQLMQNLKRLKEIGSYRGMRHAHGLPVRGQRTKSNGRTRRGKRQTVGALKKEDRAKMDTKTTDVKTDK